MNTIVNITGITLNLLNINDENVIKKIKKNEYNKKRYSKNKERMRERAREQYKKHKEKRIRQIIFYQKNKFKSDLNFKLKINLRNRVRKALKDRNKSVNTATLIGCSIEQLWIYLEKLFKPGMTHKNHGLWHIDHIKPCASFDLTKASEQRKCFHYTNLQPLWASENLSKGDRIS